MNIDSTNDIESPTPPFESAEKGKIDVGRNAGRLVVACFLGLIANWVGTGATPVEALPGMAILYAASVIGLCCARFMPFYLPGVAWISLVAILFTIPGAPGAGFVSAEVEKLDFLAIVTPALAYGGLALTSNEFAIARRSGWKIVVIAICVMIGTYLGSVVVADLMLRVSWETNRRARQCAPSSRGMSSGF